MLHLNLLFFNIPPAALPPPWFTSSIVPIPRVFLSIPILDLYFVTIPTRQFMTWLGYILTYITMDQRFYYYCFDGVVIAAQCPVTFQNLLCSAEFRYY